MLGHHDVSGDVEPVTNSRLLQCAFEQVARSSADEKLLAAVAAKRQEVKASTLLIPP